MKKPIRKFTALLLSLMMTAGMFTALPVSVSAASAEEIAASADAGELAAKAPETVSAETDDGFVYTQSGDNASITGYNGAAEAVVIPQIVGGFTVMSIASNAFKGKTFIRSVTMPDTVTEIGKYAFYNCANLASVTLSKGLKTLGQKSFSGTALTSIEIPSLLGSCSVEGYNTYSFNNKNYNLFYGPFGGLDTLKNVTFESGVTEISKYLFCGCTGLETVVIPNTVTVIENDSFRDCLRLSNVTMPDTVTDIGGYAFYRCMSLNNIVLSKALVNLGQKSFTGTALTAIEIPRSLNSCSVEGNNAYSFNNKNYNLSYGPFGGLDTLKNVTFEQGRTKINTNMFRGCTGPETITVPDTVNTIEGYAFADCLCLTSVIMSDNVKEIGEHAFYRNISLPGIDLPKTITSIKKSTFELCESLEGIDIPDSVKSIGDYTFDGCSSLKRIDIPDSVTSIGKCLFMDCSSLASVSFSKKLKSIPSSAFRGSGLLSVTVPNNITSIGSYAFADCSLLTSAELPQSLATMDNYAFNNCEVLSDVSIADYSITKINTADFKDCPEIRVLYLPKGLQRIESQAFVNCTGLTEIHIPVSVTYIADNAFSYPDRMTAYGKAGSYAEQYCNSKGITFINYDIPALGIVLDEEVCDDEDYIEFELGQTKTVKFEVYPLNTTDVISMSSSHKSIHVDRMNLNAEYTGDAVITAVTTSGLTYTFNTHVKSVSSVELVSVPSNLEIPQGTELDTSEIELKVNFSDGSSKLAEEFSISGYNKDVLGAQTVTVTYTAANGKTFSASFEVEVTDPRGHLIGIEIETLPVQLKFTKYEALDTTGMVVVNVYDSGLREATDAYTVSGYNALRTGVQTITVTKGEYTATYQVEVFKTNPYSSGDTNLDGKLDVNDVTNLQKYLAKLFDFSSGQIGVSDTNADGVVNIKDATKIQKMIAGF